MKDIQSEGEIKSPPPYFYALRHCFTVVGILEHGKEEFFDMINSRVQCVDMTLNSHVKGSSHESTSSGGGAEKMRCKLVFQNVTKQ